MPFKRIKEWLKHEEQLGSTNPLRGVLATAGKSGVPRSRIVALREISDDGVLFFTQRGTRKVKEMMENPNASMTIWLAQQQRQIILNGAIYSLTQEENKEYWKTIPHDRQLRFTAYAPISATPIVSLDALEHHYQNLCVQYQEKEVPMSDFYVGFRLNPNEVYFYTLGSDAFSECVRYTKNASDWHHQLISP